MPAKNEGPTPAGAHRAARCASTLARVAAVSLSFAAAAVAQARESEAPAPARAWVRVNLVGYLPDDPKVAVLSSELPLRGEFAVGGLRADLGPDEGAWGPFAHNYRLDFSAVREPGRYRVRVEVPEIGPVESAPFRVGPRAYEDARAALLSFLKLQRCGDNPVTGERCHQDDAVDVATGERVDLTGGWHDAGDRIKHSITTSYCVAALFLAGCDEEARYGAEHLRRLHPAPEVLYVQVGDDRDHTGGWTLWHDDRVDYGFGAGGARAAWRATGAPEGPQHKNASTGVASLAGRCAAALALAGDLDSARSLYALAVRRPGCAQSVPVRAPYYYGERTWHDDVEWAAVELYRATGEEAFRREAVRQAHLAHDTSWMGRARHGHYGYFPYVDLAHFRLWEVTADDEDTRRRLATYYRNGLEEVRRRAEENPYRVGTPIVWCSTNDVIAFATQAALYEKMTGDDRYRSLAAEARDWIFGRNPWGVSFVTGVPEHGAHARDVHHPFAILGELPPLGGLVDGPVEPDIHRALEFGELGPDALRRFQSEVAIYRNDTGDFSTNEPILDGTVSLLLLLAVWR